MRKVLILVLTLLVLAPTASAQCLDCTSTPDKPLYSDESGFHHARLTKTDTPTSIVVEFKERLRDGVSYWNHRAGWKLFRFAEPDEPFEVGLRFDPERPYTAFCYQRKGDWWYQGGPNWPDFYKPYVYCALSLASDADLRDIAHEMGHTLGLMHQAKGIMYNDTDHKDFDRKLLVNAGYAQ